MIEVDYWDNDTLITHCIKCRKEIRITEIGEGEGCEKAKDVFLGGSGGGKMVPMFMCIECLKGRSFKECLAEINKGREE